MEFGGIGCFSYDEIGSLMFCFPRKILLFEQYANTVLLHASSIFLRKLVNIWMLPFVFVKLDFVFKLTM